MYIPWYYRQWTCYCKGSFVGGVYMSDSSALRLVINGAWQAFNTTLTWNGFTFTFGQLLVLCIAIVIVVMIIKFFV